MGAPLPLNVSTVTSFSALTGIAETTTDQQYFYSEAIELAKILNVINNINCQSRKVRLELVRSEGKGEESEF